MKLHPKIERFINIIKETGINEINRNDKKMANILKESGATSTEAMISIHLGLGIADIEAETIINSSQLWEPEHIQDIAYQTFLYMNYNPDDPDFSYDENDIKFNLFDSSKNSKDKK
jgi:hypothetical protein